MAVFLNVVGVHMHLVLGKEPSSFPDTLKDFKAKFFAFLLDMFSWQCLGFDLCSADISGETWVFKTIKSLVIILVSLSSFDFTLSSKKNHVPHSTLKITLARSLVDLLKVSTPFEPLPVVKANLIIVQSSSDFSLKLSVRSVHILLLSGTELLLYFRLLL